MAPSEGSFFKVSSTPLTRHGAHYEKLDLAEATTVRTSRNGPSKATTTVLTLRKLVHGAVVGARSGRNSGRVAS